jgi:hypothetical protein
MNPAWRIEFLLLEAARHPAQRENYYQLAAEWIVKAHLEER